MEILPLDIHRFKSKKGASVSEEFALFNWSSVGYMRSTKTPKGMKDALKATAPLSKHYKQKAKRTVSFPKIGQTAIQNKINYQDIRAKTCNDKNSKI